jgi:Pathogenicity locus
MKAAAFKEFRTIPGVGQSVAGDFWNLGLRKVADLKRRNPQRLYDTLCKFEGVQVDRCMLYVMRCAVYFASTKKPKPDLLKWWNWKDRK